MSLIACYECNKEISSEARACPGCGAKRKRSPIWIGLALGLIAMVAMFVIVTVAMQSSEDKAIATAKEGVRRSLKNPESAQFRDVVFRKEKVEGEYTSGYICGHVTGMNSFGALAEERRFVARAFFGGRVLDVTNLQIEPGPSPDGNVASRSFEMVYWLPVCG
ncbi:hypothetical protein [Chromobacterium violaceum]|uniref:hypothetical protein n=1 Tax=Chromobacterium violaceum TaxID=536 RepID=UPI00194F7F6D|nr:hypothetical protein [Chromobacterium violaceum]QRO34001.1 hypothetical protein I6K04_04455 [Chromobacterium violaceum]QRQ16196.1 hypothetical protein I6K03_18275 [Chromobacterium violaceum]